MIAIQFFFGFWYFRYQSFFGDGEERKNKGNNFLIQKAIDLLKVRWPEVMLVVVLQAAMMLLAEEVVVISENAEAQGPMLPFWASFLLGLGI
ncbi:MAG: hypothetical protein ACYSOJ_08245, partial [Planctomycetota bacterium]